MRKLAITAITALFVLANASLALCAEIVGTVSDTQGNPVQGVQITAQTSAGRVVGQAFSSANGKYQITQINPGTYDFLLNPLQSGFKAGSGVADLNSKGLTINWKLSPTAPALALASEGTEVALAGDPFGYSAGEFAALLVLAAGGVAAGVVGGYGAAGGFSSSPSAASPAL
ncbi:MAG: carboxypeptidase regulatory-like domain-containing protein [Candidatus Binataceae bacterium]|nr:carboxypeptidase regulatory-like domain-containing protein [Candidatus Binataceae bacterium]